MLVPWCSSLFETFSPYPLLAAGRFYKLPQLFTEQSLRFLSTVLTVCSSSSTRREVCSNQCFQWPPFVKLSTPVHPVVWFCCSWTVEVLVFGFEEFQVAAASSQLSSHMSTTIVEWTIVLASWWIPFSPTQQVVPKDTNLKSVVV